MYGVFFHAADLAFVDPEEFATQETKTWRAKFDGAEELRAVTGGIKLGGAPLASWVLARLAGMSESSLFPGDFVRRECELGGYRIRFLVVRGSEPVAKLRLAAEGRSTELTSTAATPEDAAGATRALIATLLSDPETLGMYRIEVRARELGGIRNEYGFDGVGLLGQYNVYE